MKNRVLSSTVVLGLILVLPRWAPASPADPTKSSIDPILVGNSSDTPMGNGFRVVVRHVDNTPDYGATVSLRFAASGARPAADQEPGTYVDCAAMAISRITDITGTVVFHPRIAGFDNSHDVQVRADGVLLGAVPVRSTDLNGDGTSDIRDLNLFRQRFLFDRSAPETDFDQNGTTDAFDLDRLREEILLRARATPCP